MTLSTRRNAAPTNSHSTHRRPARSDIISKHRTASRDLNPRGRPYGPVRLPVNGFTYYPTLSSKCFSTFPHGTCLLSDSQRYLALDGVYHPLRAAFSNNPTPESALDTQLGAVEALHPLWDKPRSGGLKHLATRQRHSQTPHVPNTIRQRDSVLGSSRFTRRYSGNPC